MEYAGFIAVASGLAAQATKVVVEVVRRRQWRPSLIVASGGMPSSHTATVTTLSFLVGHQEGPASSVFSLVLVFSLYVVFEATGLRQEVGKQAELINDLVDEILAGRSPDQRRLKELVGHTWQEVLAGFAFGALMAQVVIRTTGG
ncbi:MAG: divergent PAP2 family protein [Candidatus Krumholzibacteriia bacterium]